MDEKRVLITILFKNGNSLQIDTVPELTETTDEELIYYSQEDNGEYNTFNVKREDTNCIITNSESARKRILKIGEGTEANEH